MWVRLCASLCFFFFFVQAGHSAFIYLYKLSQYNMELGVVRENAIWVFTIIMYCIVPVYHRLPGRIFPPFDFFWLWFTVRLAFQAASQNRHLPCSFSLAARKWVLVHVGLP